jgi:hypothetical protein
MKITIGRTVYIYIYKDIHSYANIHSPKILVWSYIMYSFYISALIHILLTITLQCIFLTYLCVASNDDCIAIKTCSLEQTIKFLYVSD